MTIIDKEKIVDMCVLRLKSIFNIVDCSVDMKWKFGEELKASFVSDFKENELDCILDDIRFVSSKEMLKRLNNEEVEITTAGDYCDFMFNAYLENPKRVLSVLNVK
jgi:hypothetical protein